MASNISFQSLDTATAGEGNLVCPVCMNRFKEPKILDCLHSFCLSCLRELGPIKALITCPTCGQKTTTNGVDDLPTNLTLSALVEEARMREQLQEGQGSEITCQSCEEENPAVSRCVECDHFICQQCQAGHERLTLMKSHKIYTLAQLRSGEIAYKSKLRDHVPKCRIHPEQDLNLYCVTCGRLVCPTCSPVDHASPEHSLISPAEALEKCKRDVAVLTAKAEQSKAALGIAVSETDKSLYDLDANFAEIREKISKKADEEVARIREQEQRLKQEAERIYNDSLFLNSMELNPHRNQRNY